MMKIFLIVQFYIGFITNQLNNFQGNQNQESDSINLEELRVLQEENIQGYTKEFLILERQLKRSDAHSQLIELYQLQGSFLYREKNYDSLITTLHLIRSMLSKSDRDELLDVYINLAEAFNFKGNYDSLVFWEEKAGDLVDAKSPYYANYLMVSSYRSSFDGSYISAISKTLEALELFEASNDLPNIGEALNSLAVEYYRLGDYQKQREYLALSIEIHKQIGSTANLILNYNNLGSSYEEKGELDVALFYYDLAYQELQKVNSPRLLAQNLSNRAGIYEGMGQYDEAERLFLECKKICDENQIGYGIMLTNLNLGDLYRLKGEFSKAFNYLNKALSLSLEMKLTKETALVYERMAWLNRDRGAYKAAYEFLDSFHTLNDSLINESVRNTANELKEKYEAEKKENQIITLSKNKIYQQLIIASMGFVMVLLLVVIQWWRNKQKLTSIKLEAAESLHQAKEKMLKQREQDLLEETMQKVVLKEQMKEILKKVSEDGNQAKVASQLRKIESKQNPWNDMVEKFKLLNPHFTEKLLETCPQLNHNDLEFCSLVKMNLSTKEIAQVLRITNQSVRTRKYRLLKKLNLSDETDLASWIMSLSNQN